MKLYLAYFLLGYYFCLSTDILVEELMSRESPIAADFNILRIYEVMAAKKNELALEMMRTYIQNLTGRILP